VIGDVLVCSLPASLCTFVALTAAAAATSAQSCPGDCNRDSEATVEEIVTLVNIALGIVVPEQCPAGDTSGDDEVTVDELQAAINVALGGCPPPNPFVSLIDVGAGAGAPGDTVEIEVTLRGATDQIAATSNDITYDRRVVQVVRSGNSPDCTIASRLGPGTTADKMLLLSILPGGDDIETLRVGVFGLNQQLISDGPLFRCRFVIATDAGTQPIILENRPGAANLNGRQFENRTCSGVIQPLACCTGPGDGTCNVGGSDGQILVSQ
jgi:hypothetical protein